MLLSFAFVSLSFKDLRIIPITPYVHAASLTISDYQAIASTSAEKYGLTEKQNLRLHKVINCESSWDPTSVGQLGELGLAQIYPKKHLELTEEQMKDPYFSLDFIAKNLYKHPTWWSCYKWRDLQ